MFSKRRTIHANYNMSNDTPFQLNEGTRPLLTAGRFSAQSRIVASCYHTVALPLATHKAFDAWPGLCKNSRPFNQMEQEAEFIRSEIPDVKSIVDNECWLEGERRGHAVDPHDEAIRERVAEIILSGAGAYLRQKRGTDRK